MNRPIRGLVLRSALGAGGGAEKIILRTADLLDKQVCELSVCAIRRSSDHAFDFDQQCASLGIDYHELVQTSRMDRTVWSNLSQLYLSRKFDFVHAHDYKAVFYAYKLKKRFNATLIATLHGWTGHSLRERYLYYPLERRYLRKFNQVIAVSSQIKDRYIRSGGSLQQTSVLLNGIDTDKFVPCMERRKSVRDRLGISDDQTLILGLGRLEQQKRFDILMDTVKLLVSQGHNKLVAFIAGDGSLKTFLEEHLAKLGIEQHCRLIGHYNNVMELYDAADVLVQSSDYEGTPTVVVEAMAMNLPIVATDAGGTAELIRHGVHGRIVPCGSPVSLAKSIAECLNKKVKTEQFVKSARMRATDELTFRKRTETLLSHINKSLTKSTAS